MNIAGKQTKMGDLLASSESKEDCFGLLDLPNELALEVLARVDEPQLLPLVCKRFLQDNSLWWRVFKYWNRGRAHRYKFETRQSSSIDDWRSFWVPLDTDNLNYDPHINYRSAVGHCVWISPDTYDLVRDLDWNKALEKPLEKRNRAGKAFGTAPVLFVCSSTGSDYTHLTSSMQVDLTPMASRVFEQTGLDLPQDFLGSHGWPGWEQFSGATADGLELLAVAYGGSDPPGRFWSRNANTFQHTRETYQNMVGIVLVADIIQFSMHQLQRWILSKFKEDVLPDSFHLLPILILKFDYYGDSEPADCRQMLWYEQDITRTENRNLIPTPTAVFPVACYAEGLRWLYMTRLALLRAKKQAQ